MVRTTWIFWSMLLLQQQVLHSAELKVRTVYASSAGVLNLKVTVRNLEVETLPQQLFLTDSERWTPYFKLPAGLYEIKGVGKGFMDTVKEVFVDDSTNDVVLEMRTISNIDYVNIVTTPTPSLSKQDVGEERRLRVQFHSGTHPTKPISQIRVLFRDSEGNGEKWFETDSTGSVNIDLPDGPTFIVMPMIVMPLNRSIYTFVILQDCSKTESLGLFPQGATCVPIKNSIVDIKIPITH